VSRDSDDDRDGAVDRRAFLTQASRVAMAGGLVAGYGAFGAVAGRFLYPATSSAEGWVVCAEIARFKVGESLAFQLPSGQRAAVARRGNAGDVSDFIALSSTCPHLGCQVFWEAQAGRFFCPCHNGTFDPSGKATGGPPAKAGQSLAAYALEVKDGLLYIKIPLAAEDRRNG
jgi:Rieske Fe-S protein